MCQNARRAGEPTVIDAQGLHLFMKDAPEGVLYGVLCTADDDCDADLYAEHTVFSLFMDGAREAGGDEARLHSLLVGAVAAAIADEGLGPEEVTWSTLADALGDKACREHGFSVACSITLDSWGSGARDKDESPWAWEPPASVEGGQMRYREVLVPVGSAEEAAAVRERAKATNMDMVVYCNTRALMDLRGVKKGELFVVMGGWSGAFDAGAGEGRYVPEACLGIDDVLRPDWPEPADHAYAEVFADFDFDEDALGPDEAGGAQDRQTEGEGPMGKEAGTGAGRLCVETSLGTLVAEDVSDGPHREIRVTLEKPDGACGNVAYVGVEEPAPGGLGKASLHTLAFDGTIEGERGEDNARRLACDPEGDAMDYRSSRVPTRPCRPA